MLVDNSTVNARARRVRKAQVVNLKACECGRHISQGEIDAGNLVMKCNMPGCEFVWVSPFTTTLHSVDFIHDHIVLATNSSIRNVWTTTLLL